MESLSAFIIIAGLFFLERFAVQAWMAAYFRFGILAYYRKAHHPSIPGASQAAANLSPRFTASMLHPSIEFKAVRPGLVALREKLFENRGGVRYLPVMHAALRFHENGSKVSVTGFFNLWVIAVLVYLFYQGSRDPSFVPVALLVGFILAVSFAFQAALYGRIVSAAASEARPVEENKGD